MKLNVETVTPAAYGKAGGLPIEYGFAETPYGKSLIASTSDKVCALYFADNNEDALVKELKDVWKGSEITRNDKKAEKLAARIFSDEDKEIPLLLRGTPFQIDVWKALLTIPEGETISYSELAKRSGNPKAVRAAGSAIARNEISYVVPCHRVVRLGGDTGQYRWNPKRKKMMIEKEKKK